jgi:NAD(P)H-hydrate epimerase
MIEITSEILKKVYPSRPEQAKKYDFGLVLIIGGGEFYSGSPALAGLAAFRAGADMVRIFAPKRAADIISSFSPNLAAYPLEGKWLEKKHLSTLIFMIQSAKEVSHGNCALLIGGGMGRSKLTQEAIFELIKRLDLPIVVDADAIYALAKDPQAFKGKNLVFTPHGFEFFVLTGKEVLGKEDSEKMEIVREEAARLGNIILLKGRTDFISDGREVAINRTGTPYLTTGGCGDTLAGICAALIARGLSPFLAAQAAAFINGRAGELASQEYGEGLLATDLISAIPKVLK